MKTRIINIYQFDELGDDAKERARQWWRECENEDFDTEYVFDDAVRMGELLGIEIGTYDVKLMNGSFRQDPSIYYSGFCSQGDGACFEGHYEYRKGAPAAIIAETSADQDCASKGNKELLRIARGLQEIQRPNFYRLTAVAAHRGRDSHSGSMSVEVYRTDEADVSDDAEETITELLRDFADWIYSQLEAEYEYRMSDESVDESIRINEYDFDEEGNRI